MTTQQRDALAELRFNWSEEPDDVWATSPYHVDGLQDAVEHALRAGVMDAVASEGSSPIGLVLQGQKGIGKTHLLGWVRREVQRVDGYFFLVILTAGDAFWDDTALAVRSGLMRRREDGEFQLLHFLRRLCTKVGVSDLVTRAIVGDTPVSVDDLHTLIGKLRRFDPQIGLECGDTVRALVLLAADDAKKNVVGDDYLGGFDEMERNDRRKWGIRSVRKPAHAVVTEVTRLLALTGPNVIALDQLDMIVARAKDLTGDVDKDSALAHEMAILADGLMSLRERTRRTLSVMACIPDSWQVLKRKTLSTVADRFREAGILHRISDPVLGRLFVEKWVGVPYQKIGFVPPYPTWPVAPSAFENAWEESTPRILLQRIDSHVESCLRGEIRELVSFYGSSAPEQVAVTRSSGPDSLSDLDVKFAELRRTADVDAALSEDTEDKVMPALLSAALQAWINEVGNDELAWKTDLSLNGRQDLHAGLHRTVIEKLDIKEYWAFRAIASKHGVAALHRLRKARAAAGLSSGAGGRHLVLIRNRRWSGKKTWAELNELEKMGGRRAEISEDDVRTFSALREMLTQKSVKLLDWLVTRKPASSSELLTQILPSPSVSAVERKDSRPPPVVVSDVGGIEIDSVRIELESLRKHVVIFAGSGSGKTVLIRRIVEECALRGVSAIVLDPNNDLARLGERWPEAPEEWGSGDADRARDYLENTDVVIWTPGRSGGRPLSFHPLPDFAGVLDDEDEFAAAVEVAAAALAPHAKVGGGTKVATRARAVLREALTHYAGTGSRSLGGFIDTLANLPEGVSELGNAAVIAADLAETLKAAKVNDPLFGGAGEPADPAILFTPAEGKRARVSVISFVGLPSDEQRQGFVNQLQMEVFAWIKRNPAGSRPLGGLFVMDEAQTLAPSGASTASTRSTIILASQARKYGLGLLFATQAPKGVHNQITGNATTQFFGRLNSPAQIAAANDMARAKGSTVGDISLLERGQFYVTGETFGFRRVRAPLCLSHHPPSPLRLEEVIERARNGAH